MPCRIEILETEVITQIGCEDAERRSVQPVLVSASITHPEKFPASKTDRVADTVDAGELRALLVEGVKTARVLTLERLGEDLEIALRERYSIPGLKWEIKLCKPRFGWFYVHTWSS